MSQTRAELLVGVFVLLGLAALTYLSIRLGKLEVLGSAGYHISAVFTSASGLKPGAVVEMAGVEVGRVENIRLDPKTYQAVVGLRIADGVVLQDDAIASIKTKGLIGEKYIRVSPGGSVKIVKDGGRLRDTEGAVDLEELISNYIHGKI
jgi:phospholipid/cholesterol/gamma-HCH transport system substrate-binding protein